jgi:hypothetical protein
MSESENTIVELLHAIRAHIAAATVIGMSVAMGKIFFGA